MRASLHGSKGSAAQKKQLTYGESSRRRLLTTQPLPKNEPSPYDFPDTETSESPSASPPSLRSVPKPATNAAFNPPSYRNHKTSTRPEPVRSPTKPQYDHDRKRKCATAFIGHNASTKRPTKASRTHTIFASPSKEVPPITAGSSSHLEPSPPVPRPSGLRVLSKPSRTHAQPTKVADSLQKLASQSRRPRLIDRLSAHKAKSPSHESDPIPSENENENRRDGDRAVVGCSQILSSQSSINVERELRSQPNRTPISKKIKHTYGQTRSIRNDVSQSDDPFGLSANSLHDSLLSSPPTRPSPGAFDFPADGFDMDDNEPKIAIKSVHELRRAGANSRFADEMEDLLSRIGMPSQPASSMRRNALLELAQKLQCEDFSVQFRDHAARDNVAKKIGKEEDLISGFAFASSLVMFLSSKNAPNLLRRLVEERIGKLLGRLLRTSDSIDAIAAQRTTNLSKMSRKILSEVKTSLLQIPIWYGRQQSGLSPRTVALQLLNILYRYLDARYMEDMTSDLRGDLDVVVEHEAEGDCEKAVDFALVISILESQAGVMTTTGQSRMSKDASHGARFLRRTLAKWPKGRGEVGSSTLKLAINTTNTEVGAEAFGKEYLLPELSRCICDGVRQVQASVDKGSLQSGFYDELLLILGVTINLLEHYPPARASMDRQTLKKLTTLYLENHKSVRDVSNRKSGWRIYVTDAKAGGL